VDDELAAEHGDVGIDAVCAEAVGGRVDSDETLAVLDGGEKFLLSLGRHGLARLRSIALSAQIAGRIEDEGVELVEIAVEHRAILAANDFDASFLPPLRQHLLRLAELVGLLASDRRVLEAGAAGEEEHLWRFFSSAANKSRGKADSPTAAAPVVNSMSRRFMTESP